MYINVPSYNEKGFQFSWEDGFSIKCSVIEETVTIEANREGLISLAKHLLELSAENVPEFTHIHLDEYNSLEDNSVEIIIVKRNNN